MRTTLFFLILLTACSDSAVVAHDAAIFDAAIFDARTADAQTADAQTADAQTADAGALELPLAWYKLDDVAGPTIEDSAGDLDGTLIGGVSLGATGQVDLAATFNGSTGTIDIGTPAALSNLGAVTVEAWVNLDSYTTYDGGVVMKTAGNGDVDFGISVVGSAPAGAIQWNSASADNSYGYYALLTVADAVPLSTWVHIAGVYEVATNTRKVYINGVEAQVDAGRSFGDIGAAPMDGTGRVRIGNYQWDSASEGGYVDGTVDDVKIWDVLRSQAQICEDAGGTPGGGGCTL